MAPTNAPMDMLAPKPKNKLRKPIVEKMRRDRINSSIEKLKLLLAKEFQAQEANTKLEKADILETAVDYMARHRLIAGQRSPQQDYRDGFSHCLKEALLFLAHHSATPESQVKLLSHFRGPTSPVKKELSPVTHPCPPATIKQEPLASTAAPLWRPW
ncbi:transcription factor HES-5-like isoform X2 [Ambystoma mexicanum]|uniref:transcription factor HES-5-like isoform X2 n=1 Tax=Ambystoma mexicanum TaxID=8296 RepID=UPI0037E8324C